MVAKQESPPAMRTLLLLPLALILSSCFAKQTQPKLEGERLNITFQPTLLHANPAAAKIDFALPQPTPLENWSQVGGNSAHMPGHIALPSAVVRAWSANIGGGNRQGNSLIAPPVVHSGRAFVMNTENVVTALDATNGTRLWRISLPTAYRDAGQMAGGLAVSGNLLFITTGSGEVIALTANKGEKVWQTPLSVPLRAAPTVVGEAVYVISHDNRVFALSALNGALLWTHSGIEENLAPIAAASPAVGNGAIAVPYSSGEIYVLRASDGRYIWHDTLTSAFSGQDPETTLAAIAAPPVIADGVLYVAGLSSGINAYGLANGQRFWRTELSTSQMPIVAGAHLFILTDDGELAALNRQDGLVRWVIDLNKGLNAAPAKRLWVGPILAGGRLIVASSDGYALSLDPETGKQVAATELREGVSVSPVVANGTLYFLTDKGRLITFRAP
jgi:outer membrane protein assembly factor BamB